MAAQGGARPLLIVTLCTVLQLCFGTVYAWSFFQSLLVRDLGWTYTDTAWAFSITIFSLGVSAAVAGALLPRLGPRLLAVAGGVMFAGGYMLASLALSIDSLILFYIGYGVVGGVGIGLGYVTPVATAARWFPERTGLATGVVVMGFGVGALLLSQGLAPFLVVRTEGDLTMVFFWLGVVFAALAIPAGLALRNPPPGYEIPPVPGRDAPMGDDIDAVAPCLRSPAFAVMWIVFFFNISAGLAVISFQSPLLQEVWGLADPTVEPETLGRVRRDADRGLFPVQRCRAPPVGHDRRPHRTRAGVPPVVGDTDGGVRRPADRNQPDHILRAGLLRAALLRRRIRGDARRSFPASSAPPGCRRSTVRSSPHGPPPAFSGHST